MVIRYAALFAGWAFAAGLMAGAAHAEPGLPKRGPDEQTRKAGLAQSHAAEAVTADAEDPAEWPSARVAAARSACLELLAPLEAEVEILPPVREGKCGAPAPVLLKSLGAGGAVRLEPAARVNCPMVAGVSRWMDEGLQPLAAKHLGAPIRTLRVVASYACRNRNGTTNENARLSEHAFANALDIASFELEDGRRIDVAGHWGPTERDLAASAKVDRAEDADRDFPAQEKVGDPSARARAAIDFTAPMTEETLELARRNLEVAETRVRAVERILRAQERVASARSAEQELLELREQPIAFDAGEDGEGAKGAGSERAGGEVRDITHPKMNPGRNAVDRARRQARRRLVVAEREAERLEALARKRERAERRRERAIRRAERDVTRQQRRAARAARRASEAVEAAVKAERRLEKVLAEAVARRPGATAAQEGRGQNLPTSADLAPPLDRKARFLRAAHGAACEVFGTVLGPEANEAHRDHFHVDLAERRTSPYCE